jgi:chromosomal replication initiation ATPase DnaA
MNTKDQAIELINKTCEFYNISIERLQKGKRKNHCKVIKDLNGKKVRLSEIRMALSYFIYKYCPLKLVEVAPLVGYSDHSTMSIYRHKIEYYINTEDPQFYPYYLKVIDIASELGITMKYERILSYTDILFKDHTGKIILAD